VVIVVNKAKVNHGLRSAEEPGSRCWIAGPILGSVLKTKHSGVELDGLFRLARINVDVVKTFYWHRLSLCP
jgi:hypothetical protein